jgi:UDP-N-acetylmuramate--alanine ligase
VAEADESDASFLHLQPVLAVVTNIDADHLVAYSGDIGRLRQGFLEFLHNLPFYGLAVMCSDDDNTRQLIPDVGRRVLSYGFGPRADVRATTVHQDGLKMHFELLHPALSQTEAFELNLAGRHNVLNAMAAISVAIELGVAIDTIRSALAVFAGIDRRLQILGSAETAAGPVLFVDDYGHHPTEIAATLSAAKAAWPDRRLVAVFQPHRYTRTQELFDDFAAVLSSCEVLLLLPVYAAGEEPICGADSKSLARAIRARGAVEPVFVDDLESLPDVLANILKSGDVVLTLGAGSIGAAATALPESLRARRPVGVKS